MIDATGMPQSAVVVGGTSDIAFEILTQLAKRRLRRVLLAGRDVTTLEARAEQLRGLGVVSTEVIHLDLASVDELGTFADAVVRRLGEIDLLLVAAGDLGTASLDDLDALSVSRAAAVNFSGPAAVTLALAQVMRSQGAGQIVVLSSVAGVRVRRANFVYGAAKAGLDGFALGLSDALEGTGVRVTVVRPGFVKTKMTTGLKPAPLAVDATTVAAATVRSLETGRLIVWVPGSLRLVFAVFRWLPQSLWRRVPG